MNDHGVSPRLSAARLVVGAWAGLAMIVASRSPSQVYAERSSGLQITRDAFSASGGQSAGGAYRIDLVLGQNVTGFATSGNLFESVGFWSAPVDALVDVEIDPGRSGDPAPSGHWTVAPNPFSVTTSVRYAVSHASPRSVTLRVFDTRGRLIMVLSQGTRFPGTHTLHWDGRDQWGHAVSSGVYWCELRIGQARLTKKIVVVQ